jgi:hypothetical protein
MVNKINMQVVKSMRLNKKFEFKECPNPPPNTPKHSSKRKERVCLLPGMFFNYLGKEYKVVSDKNEVKVVELKSCRI